MRLDPETLDRPAPEGTRAVALALLADATDAAARAGGAADADALHDFRVAVRRLRSTLRAWRPALGSSLRRKDLRRLRRVARATNAARDAEVTLDWLAEAGRGLAAPHRPAAEWLAARLEHRRHHALGPAVEGSVQDFLRLAPRLARRLAVEDPGSADAVPFGLALAALVRAQAAEVEEALARAGSPADAVRAHRARIEEKRLRYLLEPLAGVPALDAAGAVKSLKRMQDALGALNDARVAGAALAAARVEAAAERVRSGAGEGPGLRPGLLALERAAHRRERDLLSEVESSYLADAGAAALAPALEVAAMLEAAAEGPRPAGPAARRYLLSGLPPEAGGTPASEVEKGWLPGVRPGECFGVVRGPAGERLFRVLHAGRGTDRRRRVEAVTPEAFAAYWPLTEGYRIRKRCHALPGGWRLDEYLDRPLVLAVAEALGAEVPPWLEPWVVREVTGERAYRDGALSRRRARDRGPVTAG
jgi:CHAD domain-containing protein